ncbi:MAG: ATP-dependent DNA helicase [Hylemonella sp.]
MSAPALRSDLKDQVLASFLPSSPLGRGLVSYQPRAGQTELALAIASLLEQGGVLVAEAGTGIGKTFAYLVPALLSGQRVLVSTASKALQDQLFGRDLPHLVQALALPVRTALLKGRASYLCLQRLESARHQLARSDTVGARALSRIEQWALSTRSGDLAELPGLDENSSLLPLVTSTRENCLGSQCPQWRSCHVNLARREALAAELVVVNHHLFFADLAVRESGMAELLPVVDTVIFDEAHQINEIGIQFLGQQFSSAQCLDFRRDLLACGLQHAPGLANWQDLASTMEIAARELRLAVGQLTSGVRLRWVSQTPEQVVAPVWLSALQSLQHACQDAAAALNLVLDLAPDFGRLLERCQVLQERLQGFMQPCASGAVRWLDITSHQVRLVESPLDIAQAVQTRLLPGPTAGERPRSWIFTSATLGDETDLRWFTEPCGLQQAQVMRVDSPFEYAHQAGLYIPADLPAPDAPDHSRAVAVRAAQWSTMIGGRTLVLTTSLRALRVIGHELQQHFGQDGQLQVLVQGQMPKRELMARFRETGAGLGNILVASASFWEGFDVPGDALQLVVIDKLPFPPPNDPLVEARARRMREEGRNPFNHYFVPEAAVALKQGAGRLIRREDDRGILVVCDTRLLHKSYGQRLIRALPPMRRLESEEEMRAALEDLTKTSTRT